MKLLLWSTMVVCMAYVARCQQVNPTSSSANPSGDGAADGGSSSSNNTFDKNKAAINGIGVFFNQLNNDLLYLRNFIMSNVGEVTQVCGCDRSVLVPFFPPGPGGRPGGGPGGPPGGPAGVPPRRAPTSVPAAVNSATSPRSRGAPHTVG